MKRIIMILLGNTIYALGVVLFIVPNGLVTGGSTGLGLAAQYFFQLPLATFVSLFNLVMFILGYLILGKKFALSTLISTLYYPLALAFFERQIGYRQMTDDTLLAALIGGLFIGVAIGLVIKNNASTGGMDIPPLILNKKLGIPVSVAMYGFDFLILGLQMLYTSQELVLYGIILVLTYTIVLDKVLLLGQSQTQVMIVSKMYKEISCQIITDLDRTTTLLKAQTGYKHYPYPVVMCVLSRRELSKLNDLVLELDPNAFMVISAVNEVRGHGFSLNKEYLQKEGEHENHYLAGEENDF